MAPSIAVLAAFDEPVQLALDGAFVDASPLSWVARDSSKPGRSQTPDRWVLHATAGWSRAHLDLPPEQLAARLLAAFAQATGSKLPTTAHLDVHRWRYALTTRPAGQICLDAPELRLAVCGDWCPGARVEGAFLSGVAAAGRLLGRLEAGPVRGATVATEDRAVPAQGSLW